MKLIATLKTKFILWVWNHTPSCTEMSRLTSRSLEQQLSLRMRFKMWLHFVICAWCRRYFDQLNFLHTHAPKLSIQMAELRGRGLSADAKTRIKTEVRKNRTLAL